MLAIVFGMDQFHLGDMINIFSAGYQLFITRVDFVMFS